MLAFKCIPPASQQVQVQFKSEGCWTFFIVPKTRHTDCIIVHCGFCWWRNRCLCDIFLAVLPCVIKKIRNKPLLCDSDVLQAKPDAYC